MLLWLTRHSACLTDIAKDDGASSDMTAQVARIAGTRLALYPRPLRLAYGGEVMRVVPDVLNPERQLVQAGAEIIGRDDQQAATEIIMLGVP